MGYFIRIAFWIFLSGCLLAKSLHISDFRGVLLQKSVKCPSDSTFYAPRNVEKQCITTALDCVRRELNGTVKEECEDLEYVDGTVEYLELLIQERSDNGYALTASWECACERWPEKTFREFVEDALSLLKQENADSLNSP